jgi:hypothetical protein
VRRVSNHRRAEQNQAVTDLHTYRLTLGSCAPTISTTVPEYSPTAGVAVPAQARLQPG